MIQRRIAQEKDKLQQLQKHHRQEIEELLGTAHKSQLKALEERHQAEVRLLEEEKKRLKEDMNKTLELERDKIRAHQRLELE